MISRANVGAFLFSTLGLLSASAWGMESNQTNIAGEPRNEDRLFRRVILEGSLANAGYSGDNVDRYSKPNGFTAGALFDLLGNRRMVLETGLLYRQFGTTYNNGLGDNTYTANYLSVPVDAKFYFSGQEETSLFVKAGIMESTLVSDNTIYQTPTTQIGARTWETAFLVGVGAKINLSSATDIVLEGDYSRSVSSVFNDASVYRSDMSGVLGLAFNL